MSKPTLSDDHVLAIGRLVTASTRLESLLIDLLRIFMGMRSPVQALIAFSHQQVSSNIDTLKALVSWNSPKDEDEPHILIRLLDDLKAITDFRNTVVHAYWTIDSDGTALAVRYSARGKFTRSRRAIASAEIHSKADEAVRLEEMLRGLRDHLLLANSLEFSED